MSLQVPAQLDDHDHDHLAALIHPRDVEDVSHVAGAAIEVAGEVVQEDLERKQSLFAEIEKHRRPDTIVTSNTSTMPLSSLTEGRTEAFKENFAITHFFNPPHIMRLLEIVRGEATTDETANSLRDFCDEKLGKEVRFCNDTPAMMANRIGVYLLFRAAAEAYEKGMNIEDVDSAIGKSLGFPKDGIFGLLDLVAAERARLATARAGSTPLLTPARRPAALLRHCWNPLLALKLVARRSRAPGQGIARGGDADQRAGDRDHQALVEHRLTHEPA